MKTPKEHVELLTLIQGAMDETLTREQFLSLDVALRRDPEAMAFYAQFMGLRIQLRQSQDIFLSLSGEAILDDKFWEMLLDDQLSAEAANSKSEDRKVPAQRTAPVQATSHTVSKIPLLTALTSLAAFFVMLAYVYVNPKHSSPLVGQLTRTVNAQWANAAGVLSEGADLRAGPLHLLKGYAELYTENGSQVILQAPVELDLESPSQLLLRQGQITVSVGRKQATFVVRTPTASIVDFGTEFGVCVDEAFNTLTHVFQGEVELRSGSNPLRFEQRLSLVKGQGGQADPLGNLNKKQGLSGVFVRPDEFDIKLKASQGSGYHRWLAYSLRLRKDSDLAAYFTFEKDPANPDVLVNAAAASDGLNGQLSSAINRSKPAWSEGRWPQKTALSFNRSQPQYVEIAADARLCINGPITIAAWIYCQTLKDGGHIVANRVSPQSFCNYQLGFRSSSSSEWRRSIHLARKLNSDDRANQISSTPLPDVFGWALVAATHDNETLKFYLNGNLVESKYWPRKQELAEAGLLIGADFAVNGSDFFNGKIDEIAILKRVLTENEIAEMYQAGKP